MTPTPLIKLDNFYLKREDTNQTGSAKDRAMKAQIKNLIDLGYRKAVISSTGNAAISAQYFCHQNNIDLTIFVSPKINPHKLEQINNSADKIITSLKPISDAFKYSQYEKAYYLRQSTDPYARIGYQTIGQELIEQVPQMSSLFIPVGSGTTLLGISKSIPSNVKLFAVQSASNCPIAKCFDQKYISENSLITDALSVKSIPLKDELISVIKKSSGTGLVIQNDSIVRANQILIKNNINTSLEGALALAGYYKCIQNNIDVGSDPVIVLTGALR